jgi:hypothetical protein
MGSSECSGCEWLVDQSISAMKRTIVTAIKYLAGLSAVVFWFCPWDPYVESVREHVSEAEKKIVFDKFHIAQHLGEAVDSGTSPGKPTESGSR